MSSLERTATNHDVIHFMLDGAGYRARVMATAKAAARGQASIVVSVEGFAHRQGLTGTAMVEDQINSSIMRWGVHHDGPGFTLTHAPTFQLTAEHTIYYPGPSGTRMHAEYSRTDEEMYMLYKTGALHSPFVKFVEGEKGDTGHGNPFFKRTK